MFERWRPILAATLFALSVLCTRGPVEGSSRVRVVGAENFYADVIAQIGGRTLPSSAFFPTPTPIRMLTSRVRSTRLPLPRPISSFKMASDTTTSCKNSKRRHRTTNAP